MKILSRNQTLTDVYTASLIRSREILVQEQSGKAVCDRCGQEKQRHLYDGRCSVDSLSRVFVNRRAEEMACAERAIFLVEELLGMCSD